jgi:hypothetical protein
MPPDQNIQTTTNQSLAPAWVDQTLRDNFIFGEVLANTKKWDGSQMLFPKLIVSPYFTSMKISENVGK